MDFNFLGFVDFFMIMIIMVRMRKRNGKRNLLDRFSFSFLEDQVFQIMNLEGFGEFRVKGAH
jgi:hypothetical protein